MYEIIVISLCTVWLFLKVFLSSLFAELGCLLDTALILLVFAWLRVSEFARLFVGWFCVVVTEMWTNRVRGDLGWVLWVQLVGWFVWVVSLAVSGGRRTKFTNNFFSRYVAADVVWHVMSDRDHPKVLYGGLLRLLLLFNFLENSGRQSQKYNFGLFAPDHTDKRQKILCLRAILNCPKNWRDWFGLDNWPNSLRQVPTNKQKHKATTVEAYTSGDSRQTKECAMNVQYLVECLPPVGLIRRKIATEFFGIWPTWEPRSRQVWIMFPIRLYNLNTFKHDHQW